MSNTHLDSKLIVANRCQTFDYIGSWAICILGHYQHFILKRLKTQKDKVV